MLKIHLVWVEKTKDAWLRQGIDHYLDRLKPFAQPRVIQVRSKRKAGAFSASQVMYHEGKALLMALPKDCFVFALDEKGKMLTSLEFARLLERLELQGKRKLAFVIGGHLGLSSDVTKRAAFCLSLSPMTFTHDMARLILLEQLYRAFTIKAGLPYHK